MPGSRSGGCASRYCVTGVRPAWRRLLLGTVAYLAARLLARLSLVVLPRLAALLLTSLLGPPVAWLRRRGWPSAAAT